MKAATQSKRRKKGGGSKQPRNGVIGANPLAVAAPGDDHHDHLHSLFYNVRTRQVEDLTGRGLDDLLARRPGVMPVSAHETFCDAPLRVLRAVRCAVRLGLALGTSWKM